MRKIIVSMLSSVDGYVESRDPQENWHNWNNEMTDYMSDFLKSVDLFIYGRKSYEQMLAFWPSQTTAFAQIMNDTPKMVFSKTLKEAQWNAKLIRNVEVEEIEALKNQEGKDAVIFAGPSIVQAFNDLNLIDEYRIIVNPVLLGDGRPYFLGVEKSKLNLKESRTFGCGNVLLVYEPLKELSR